ncbi:MAG: lcfB 1 [Acidimicrobiales bacterium]|nr:lcfB 1 [Acidimicrobiales bacterium]
MADRSEAAESLFPPYAPTLPALLAQALTDFRDQEFLIGADRRLTYRQADDESARVALGLLALGVGKGTRVGIMMPNSPDWVICFLAVARIGALAVPISTLYQAPELAWVLAHADVQILLMVDRYLNHDYVERLQAIPGFPDQQSPELVLRRLPFLRRVVVWGTAEQPWAQRGPDFLVSRGLSDTRFDREFLDSVEATVAPADDLMIIYTSGSTVEPKAVVHTHAAAIRLSYALQASGWGDVRLGDRLYSTAPFFWVGGHNSYLLPALFTGACLVLPTSPDLDDVLDACEREQVTIVLAGMPQLKALGERAASRGVRTRFRTLQDQVDANGAPIPHELVPNVLGMTETFGPHGLERRGTRLPPEKAGAFGRSLPGLERKVVDPTTGEECGPGESGELYVRGYSVMRGFYKRLPEETFQADGYYATGDRCRIDADGFLYFEGRFGEMIKTSGANVSPREVEVALEREVAIREAAVFGVPDPGRGEAVVAVVVPMTGASIDRDQLLDRLKDQLSHYKVPRFVFTMDYDDIPRTNTSKVRKQMLRDLVIDRWEQLTGPAH